MIKEYFIGLELVGLNRKKKTILRRLFGWLWTWINNKFNKIHFTYLDWCLDFIVYIKSIIS